MRINLAAIAWLLTTFFAVLKLADAINWSWWWVLSPLLIFYGLIFVALALLGVAAVVIAIAEHIRGEK